MVYGNFEGDAVDEDTVTAILWASMVRSNLVVKSLLLPTTKYLVCPTPLFALQPFMGSAALVDGSAKSLLKMPCAVKG
jgi:hypothetical protein